MQRAELVSIGITKISEIDRAVAKSRRVFTGSAAIRHTRGMPSISLLRRFHGEPDRAAISVRRGFPVDGRRNREVARRTDVEIAVLVSYSRSDANGPEDCVVELFGNLEIIHTEHHMTEHNSLLLRLPPLRLQLLVASFFSRLCRRLSNASRVASNQPFDNARRVTQCGGKAGSVASVSPRSDMRSLPPQWPASGSIRG